jgi:hypothetical protein
LRRQLHAIGVDDGTVRIMCGWGHLIYLQGSGFRDIYFLERERCGFFNFSRLAKPVSLPLRRLASQRFPRRIETVRSDPTNPPL